MSTFNKWNRTEQDRENQYWSRGAVFGRKVEYVKNDHRDAEDGLTTEGLTSWVTVGHSYRLHRRLRRSRTPERVVVAGDAESIRQFAAQQYETRSAFNWARKTRPQGALRQLWRHFRNH